jgi:hypothetical protein
VAITQDSCLSPHHVDMLQAVMSRKRSFLLGLSNLNELHLVKSPDDASCVVFGRTCGGHRCRRPMPLYTHVSHLSPSWCLGGRVAIIAVETLMPLT